MSGVMILLCSLLISSPCVGEGQGTCHPRTPDNLRALHPGRGQLPQSGPVPPDSAYSLSFQLDKPRLDFFVASLRANPDATLHVFVYGGRIVKGDEVNERIKCIRDYLTVKKGIDQKRVTVKDGGYRDRLTVEIFYNSTKQPEPPPTPTVDPQDVSRVKKTSNRSNCGSAPSKRRHLRRQR